MPTVLDDIVAGVREDLADAQAVVPLRRSRAAGRAGRPGPRRRGRAAPPRARRSSPRSSGPARAGRARRRSPTQPPWPPTYEAGGASAISVLTERRRFGGSLDDLDAVRTAVRIPVLRKDFIVEDYQVLRGAAARRRPRAAHRRRARRRTTWSGMQALARDLGMTALVEVHDEDEPDRAVDAGAPSSASTPATSGPSSSTATLFGATRPLHPGRLRQGGRVRRRRARTTLSRLRARGRRRRAGRRGAGARQRPPPRGIRTHRGGSHAT